MWSRFVLGGLLVLSCSAPAPPSRSAVQPDPLVLDADARASLDARCAKKIRRSPFAYFRFTNRPFVDLICAKYGDTIPSMPLVHTHGDAHLEQYAVAEEGRGLADYDASAVGPPVVDFVRFATSLVLARLDDPAGARAAIAAFVAAYARALGDPDATAMEPRVASRLRSAFAPSKTAWLDRAEKLISPLSAAERDRAGAAWVDFVSQIRRSHPDLQPAYFAIKAGGHLDMGVGSYRAQKFLVRIEGPTTAADDDLMLEAKALEARTLGSCMRGLDLDAMRVVRGQSQISNAPQRFLGAVTIQGRPFYTHTWLTHYTELSVGDIRTADELREVAEDVGVQLGKGHPRTADGPAQVGLRRDLVRVLAEVAPRLAETALELAERVQGAYRDFLGREIPDRTAWR